MRIRPVFFWLHLICGVMAGAVILLMSVTGVLLTYERQLVAWSDTVYRSTPVGPRPPIATLLPRVQSGTPDHAPVTSLVVSSNADAPVIVTAGARTYIVDAYSGRILGESAPRLRRFMTGVRGWHRWFGVDGPRRAVARGITGWANLLFLFIVGSGIYLWLPRRWTWTTLRPVLWFKRTATGKARDFNWHNVAGIWSAVPLFIVVLCAVPMSFPWANTLVYRAMGEAAPAVGGRDGGSRTAGVGANAARSQRGDAGTNAAASFEGLDALFARAMRQEPDWRTITLRLPASPRAPLAFAIDRGNGGQPQLRSTLTLSRSDASVIGYDTFSQQSPARRVRSIMRFAHTGEVLGLPGQTIAGLASLGGAMLVCTGFLLAIRRLLAWIGRRRRVRSVDIRRAA
jgi:uncharacterized iron-regulated membrane protein